MLVALFLIISQEMDFCSKRVLESAYVSSLFPRNIYHL